jgi:hypothetical protein
VPPLSPLPHGGRFPFQLPEGQTSCKLVGGLALAWLIYSRSLALTDHHPLQDLVEIDEGMAFKKDLATLSLKKIENNNLLLTVQFDKVRAVKSFTGVGTRRTCSSSLITSTPPHFSES